MTDPLVDRPREVPGGARRADTFLLVIATVVTLANVVVGRAGRPPVLALIMTGVWFQILGRWLRHLRPAYVSAADFVGALFLGAGLYAWLAR